MAMVRVPRSIQQEVLNVSGFFSGEEYTDTVTIGDLVIKNQSIGVAEIAFGFNGVDGILGLAIGPDDLTEDTTSTSGEIPTVVDNAYVQGLIVSFEPTRQESITNDEVTF
ncbi:hypothetical protein GSI_08741 [Ganoderma sinense ZZ0214-1]|uniref:Peptidase A1 domain-containing protein n=1 Tax=Ganoderma sinense ZZ0214-1 TaxID=1077348 RepID=A0A2G8S4N6_9APHY|nr:hypothetical protein GSI_08741 [Ganoderma sinense ZZ0214-1]